MNVATTQEIVVSSTDPTRGQLRVHVFVDSVHLNTIVHMSGPLADIRQYMAGEIDAAEVQRRWRI